MSKPAGKEEPSGRTLPKTYPPLVFYTTMYIFPGGFFSSLLSLMMMLLALSMHHHDVGIRNLQLSRNFTAAL
jgi:hypothetical protein